MSLKFMKKIVFIKEKNKNIVEMSERERRKRRKDWRSRSKLYYERKKQVQII